MAQNPAIIEDDIRLIFRDRLGSVMNGCMHVGVECQR